ncbi:MAG TPA: glutamyl-tRNA reductase [Alphaproteobacteria bacterium]|nr:glutamyl-tRNA reductase [Alphaproteobacteria bacterium]
MAGGAHAPADFVVVGANHRSSTATLRDLIFVEDGAAHSFLRRLGQRGIGQALVLSTCDRVEIEGVASDRDAARRVVAAELAARARLDPATLEGQLYCLSGASALRHMFGVAASLDSAVVGEPQVLGQLKAAHRLSRDAGTIGNELETALQAAYGAAKRVRSETAIALGPVSIVATAIELAREVHGELEHLTALVVGSGEMGQYLAEEFKRAGLTRLIVTAPNFARAEALARRLDGHFTDFATFASALTNVDVVITNAGLGKYLVTGEMMEHVLRRRRRRPVYLIDLGVPSDVEGAVNRVDDAYLYDLADLERLALAGRVNREAAADAAWRIVDDELAAFERARAERAAVPMLVALRRHFERVREEVLAQGGRVDAGEATRLLINRLLHDPSEVLRALGADVDERGDRALAERLLQRLFRLDAGENSPGDEQFLKEFDREMKK